MRLIDKQVAIDALCKSECGCNNAECRHKDGTDFYVTCDNVKIINSLPSAQPDIIHCKDCKHWTHIKRTNRYWCKTDNGLFDLNPSPDDFCSRAERREDGQTD